MRSAASFLSGQPTVPRSTKTPSPMSPRPPRVRRGVIGILRREEKLLVIQRAAGIAKGGCWCFPGGHVEPGETPKQALRRELMEELSIDTAAVRRLGSIRVLDSNHVLAVWVIRYVSGEMHPSPREVAALAWLDAAAIRALPAGLASNERVLQMLGV